MASTEAENAASSIARQASQEPTAQSDIIESSHIQANSAGTISIEEDHARDDPATAAAREELRHTSISERSGRGNGSVGSASAGLRENRQMDGLQRGAIPTVDLTSVDSSKEISSPKKKRGRDQDDDGEYSDDSKIDEVVSADGTTSNGGRTARSEPEKKRHRDTSEGPSRQPVEPDSEVKETTQNQDPSKDTPESDAKVSSPNPTSGVFGDKPHTSASAFASSGFGALASSNTSPFGTVGANKPSIFGGGAQSSTNGFGALATKPANSFGAFGGGMAAAPADKPLGGFGGGFGGSTSGFGSTLGQKSVFGSALSNGFGSGAAPKLSSFAAPGKENTTIAPAKPAKAFGAPDSDAEEGSDEEDGSDAEAAEDDDGDKVSVEDKKKFKVSKVPIDDGEAGEATLLQLRAKLYTLESKEVGWKERGVGTVKINVNKSCVEIGENGLPEPESLDFSSMEEDNTTPAARLVMRQENTHRVILNTIIVQAMEFREKPSSATSAQILFTAFEGDKEPKPVNMLLKLSEANARLFTAEIKHIQYELKDLP